MANNSVRAIIIGAAGRMGQRLLTAIHETSDILLAGAVEREDHPQMGRDVGEMAGLEKWNVPLTGSLRKVIASGDVIIDFTNAEAALTHLRVAAEQG